MQHGSVVQPQLKRKLKPKTEISFRYSDLRLVDIPGITKSLPLTIEIFSKRVQESSEKAARLLQTEWVPACVKIISDKRQEIEALMPDDEVRFFCSNGFVINGTFSFFRSSNIIASLHFSDTSP